MSEGRERPRRAIGADAAVRAAVGRVLALTGRELDGVVALEPDEEGWRIGVEVVETRRIPDSADILALFEVEVDDTGELRSYRRVRRRARGDTERGQR